MAKLRLLAQILGVRFDDLRQREQERRARRLRAVGAVLAFLLIVMAGLAAVALNQRNEARTQTGIATTQRERAEQGEALAKQRLEAANLNLSQVFVEKGDRATDESRPLDARRYFAQAVTLHDSADVRSRLLDARLYTAAPAWEARGDPGGGDLCADPSGRLVAVADLGLNLRLLDADTGRVLHTFAGDGYTSPAFDPKGERLACGGRDVRAWDVKEKKLLWTAGTGPCSASHSAPTGLGRRTLDGRQGLPTERRRR